MLDQRFIIQLPERKLVGEERFIKIVKKNFPDRLKQRLLHAHMNIPFRSHECYPHSIHEQLDGLRMKGGLKGNRKQLALRRPHHLKRSDIQTSRSEPNISQAASDVPPVLPRIAAASSLSHTSSLDSGSEILEAIDRESTFYPYGWPKTIGKVNAQTSVQFNITIGDDSTAVDLKTDGLPYLLPAKQCLTLPYLDHKSTEHLSGNEVSSRKHTKPRECDEANIIHTLAAEQSKGSDGSMDNLQCQQHIQTQLPAILTVQVGDNSRTNHLCIQSENVTPYEHNADKKLSGSDNKISFPAIDSRIAQQEDRYSPSPFTEPEDDISRKPVVPSLCPLRDLVNVSSVSDSGRPLDQYSMYFKYHSDKAVIDCSTYTKHARKPVSKHKNNTENDVFNRP